MPAISHSVKKEKVKNGEKKQTIRPMKTDYWLRWEKGDRAIGYWKQRSSGESEKLYESEFSEDPFQITWGMFYDELMRKDGFKSPIPYVSDVAWANIEFFIPQYGENGRIKPGKKFAVLRWD